MPKSTRSATQILDSPAGVLRQLYVHSRQLLALQNVVRELFPDDVFVAGCEDGTLHLITPSSALATRLRYREQQLLGALRRRASDWRIEHVHISVRPDFKPETQRIVKSAKPPSPESARQLESTAKYIEDESLRKALIQLARRVNDPPD